MQPKVTETEESDETQDLQKAMLDYLADNGQDEPSYLVGIIYRINTLRLEISVK